MPRAVPTPDDDEYARMIRFWAAHTGLEDNDPYVITTAHFYGLSQIVLEAIDDQKKQGDPQNIDLQSILDRFDRIEHKLGFAPSQNQETLAHLSILPEVLDQLDRIEADNRKNFQSILARLDKIEAQALAQKKLGGATTEGKAALSTPKTEEYLLLILKGIAILITLASKPQKQTSEVPPAIVPPTSESKEVGMLKAAMGKFSFKPIQKRQGYNWWVIFIITIFAALIGAGATAFFSGRLLPSNTDLRSPSETNR
jgi:hypothetical protein